MKEAGIAVSFTCTAFFLPAARVLHKSYTIRLWDGTMAACTLDFIKEIIISKIFTNDSELYASSPVLLNLFYHEHEQNKKETKTSINMGFGSVQNGYVTSRSSTIKASYWNQPWGGTVSKKTLRNTILIHRFREFDFEYALLP